MQDGGIKIRRRWKVVVPVATVAVLAAGAAGWAVFLRPSGNKLASGMTYQATTVTTGTIRQSVSSSGTIAAKSTEDLSFSSSGEVTAVYVTAGSKVKVGQKLATIDSASLKSTVAAAEATVASAKARLASDQADSATSQQIASDEANITVAEKQLTEANSALAGATLTATIAGTVTTVNVAVGQQVTGGSSSSGSSGTSAQGSSIGGSSSSSLSSSSSSSSSSAAVEIISTGSYVINASVDSSDVALIKKGNQVVITPSDSTTTVYGLVSSVGIVATSSSGVATFPVVIDVTGSPTGLYPGATASLVIVYKQVTNVVVVATQAISQVNGVSTVLVQSGTKRVTRTVVTGLTSGNQTQIKSGLTAGEQILVAVRTGNIPGGTGNRNSSNNQGTYGGRIGTGGGYGGGGGFPAGGFPGGGYPGGGFGGGGS